jgi:hypothetical protein
MGILSNNNIELHRPQGGQPGNQNARIHGLYSKTLDVQEQADYEEARSVLGLDEEIAFMRAKIMSVQRNDPHNVAAMTKAMGSLCRLVSLRGRAAGGDTEGLKRLVEAVLTGIGGQLASRLWSLLAK